MSRIGALPCKGGGGAPDAVPPRARGVDVRAGGGSKVKVESVSRHDEARDTCWRPKSRPLAGALRDWFGSFRPLLPAPPPPRPTRSARAAVSSRLRSRHKRRCAIWRHAAHYIATLNSLDEGRCHRKTLNSSLSSQSWERGECWSQLHSDALREAVRLERARRCHPDMTGVSTLAALLKSSALDEYTVRV